MCDSKHYILRYMSRLFYNKRECCMVVQLDRAAIRWLDDFTYASAFGRAFHYINDHKSQREFINCPFLTLLSRYSECNITCRPKRHRDAYKGCIYLWQSIPDKVGNDSKTLHDCMRHVQQQHLGWNHTHSNCKSSDDL